MPSHQIFVNMPVRDLAKSKAFFAAIGFSFNPQFTDDNAACMILGDRGYAMLLTETFFKTFTKRAVSDARERTEVMIALSCDSRGEVDTLLDKALGAGATRAMDPVTHGDIMYGASFYDPDGHHWEFFWMDPKMAQPQN